jgi:hypothetical protein
MGGGGGGGFTGLTTTAASPQFTTEIYNSVQKHVVRNWDGPDAKAFSGIYKSNWVCSAWRLARWRGEGGVICGLIPFDNGSLDWAQIQYEDGQ